MKASSDEIDLHGLTVEEAIPLVDKFLHKAYKSRTNRVWVIHGKGTGELGTAMKEYLRKHPFVARCSRADGSRGGIGSTQVEIID